VEAKLSTPVHSEPSKKRRPGPSVPDHVNDAPTGSEQAQLLALQRNAGNQAVVDLIRKARPVQREPSALGAPADTQRPAAWVPTKSESVSLDAIQTRFHDKADHYIGEWAGIIKAAVNSIDNPEDPDASFWWGVALAGNLLWALSALTPVMWPVDAAIAALVATSIALPGAAVGSGAAQKLFGGPSPPSAKEVLIPHIAKIHDMVLAQVHASGTVGEAALVCVEQKTSDLTKQDETLFRRMFPADIPFAGYDKAITEMAQAKTHAAFNDFMAQWKAWNKLVNRVYRERMSWWEAENGYGPRGEPGEGAARGARALMGRETPRPTWSDVMRDNPFNPVLKF
jgi:hypothetical protein